MMCGSFAIVVGLLLLVGPSCTNSDNLALLLDTLKPVQRTVCDEEVVSLACPTGTSISILVAQYGGDPPEDQPCEVDKSYQCKLPNKMQYMLLQRVVEACQKKPSCVFSTNPGPGDPCPNSRKYVEVSYKCRPYEFRSINGCDDQTVRLSCNPHSRIAVYDVQYGRAAYETIAMSCPQPQGVPDESCSAPYAVETAMRICHGKRRCQFKANRDTFTTTCKPYSRPYVKVIYACVPLGVLTERYESGLEKDERDGAPSGEDLFDESDGADAGEEWRESNPVPPIADHALQPPTESAKVTTKSDTALQKTSVTEENNQDNSLKLFIYIGAGVILFMIVVIIIVAVRCYYAQKAKENAKNGNMFTTETPNVFSDAISDMDNDVEVSHISGTFYDPVHPDMILYRDADGTRNTLRAMRPLSTIYPCAGARMYGNADHVPQPREIARFPRSKSNEEETDPDVMTSPKSLSAYSASRFYYG